MTFPCSYEIGKTPCCQGLVIIEKKTYSEVAASQLSSKTAANIILESFSSFRSSSVRKL